MQKKIKVGKKTSAMSLSSDLKHFEPDGAPEECATAVLVF